MLRLYTFGGLRIEQDGQFQRLPTPKASDLLAYLLAFRYRSHPRPVMAGIFWPDLPEENARRRLSDTLWRLRRALGDCVVANEDSLQFNTELPCWIDVAYFEDLISESGPQTPENLEEALRLYCGPFLDGIYHDWVLLERERLQGVYLELLNDLLQHYKQNSNYPSALQIAQRLVATEPLFETAHCELIRIYHLLDRDTEAVAQYHQCRQILQTELGVNPSLETEALYRELSQYVPSPEAVPAAHLPTPARQHQVDLDNLPLTGRETDRKTLLAHLERAAAGQGNMLLVEGEAGIGKTRLVQELTAGARWRNISVLWMNARDTESASYAPLLSALTPELTPLRIRQLRQLMEHGQLQALVPLLPVLAENISGQSPIPELSPPEARERLQEALVSLMIALARISPHLLILEDLHWADAETISLLPLLLPQLSKTRMLFLLTGRSAELRAHSTTWQTLQILDRIQPLPRLSLSRLGAEEIASLTQHLLSQDTPHLSRHLLQASEGVPLYVVETLKAWRDDGHLITDKALGWHWLGEIPATASTSLGMAVINHRLSSLSTIAAEMLNLAAVIGNEMDYDLLENVYSALSTEPEAAIVSHLLTASEELLCLGFLVETEIGYRFSHAQVRQAVYQQLPAAQRKRFHYQVAQSMEALFPEHYEQLAQHYIATEDHGRAIHYLTLAAERAHQIYAHRAALSHYERLLELLPINELVARFDILHERVGVLNWTADRQAQSRDLGEMLHLARELGDDVRLAQTLYKQGEWHRVQGNHQAAEKDSLAALKLYRRLDDDHNQAYVLSQLGYIIMNTVNFSNAANYLQEALSIYQSLDDLDGQVDCLIGLANAAELNGNFSLSLSHTQQCLGIAEVTGNPKLIQRAIFNLGVIQSGLGDMEAARSNFHQALGLSETTGDRRRQAATCLYLGMVSTELNDFENAHSHLDLGLEAFRQIQDLSWEADALTLLGKLALLQNNPMLAYEYFETALQYHRETGEPGYAAIDRSCLAITELALGNKEAAWRRSQDVVIELNDDPWGIEDPQQIYYHHFCIASATSRWFAARNAIERAAEIANVRIKGISDPVWREKYLTGARINREITAAMAQQPTRGQLRVHLPHAHLPEETVRLIWTVDTGKADTTLGKREGKVALRRQRILRLLAEAEASRATPMIADLAGALDVSIRTIQGDLSALRKQGHMIRTHRGRS